MSKHTVKRLVGTGPGSFAGSRRVKKIGYAVISPDGRTVRIYDVRPPEKTEEWAKAKAEEWAEVLDNADWNKRRIF